MSTITLPDKTSETLRELVKHTGKKPEELIHQALADLRARLDLARRRRILEEARGLWKDRQDLPDFEALRREWDRRD